MGPRRPGVPEALPAPGTPLPPRVPDPGTETSSLPKSVSVPVVSLPLPAVAGGKGGSGLAGNIGFGLVIFGTSFFSCFAGVAGVGGVFACLVTALRARIFSVFCAGRFGAAFSFVSFSSAAISIISIGTTLWGETRALRLISEARDIATRWIKEDATNEDLRPKSFIGCQFTKDGR